MSPAAIRGWFVVHEWTSLVCMVFMLMLCITGLPLIFHEEIDHVLGYSVEPPAEVDAEGPASVDAMIAHALDRRPGDVMQFVVADPHEPDAVFIRVGESPNGAITAFDTYDARTGELVSEYPLEQGVMNVLLRLHVDMFAGLKGMLFLGFMGLVFLVSLVSGVVLYAPFMGRLAFGTVRKDRSSRLQWLDTHNLVGIITLVWFGVVGATGVVHTVSGPIFQEWQETELARAVDRHPGSGQPIGATASVDRVLSEAAAARPDAGLSFLAFPGTAFAGASHFVAYMEGGDGWRSRLLEPLLIDARSAEVLGSVQTPWTVDLLMISQPLHFGDYGGLPLKTLWAVLDILSIVVLVSGLVLWLKRRRWAMPSEEWLRRSGATAVVPSAGDAS